MRVLDASAMLALIQGERGHDQVIRPGLAHCASAVNMAEVRSKLSDSGLAEVEAELVIRGLHVPVRDFSDDQSRRSGALRPVTKSQGLSLADRACLALAQSLGATAVTADKIWETLSVGVQVEVIR